MQSKREIKNEVKFEIIEALTHLIGNFDDSIFGESLSNKEYLIAKNELEFQAERIKRFLNYPPR